MQRTIKEFSVHFDPVNESNTFTNGDIVEGRVVLELTKEVNVESLFVKLTGDADVSWTEGSDDDSRSYHDHERYFKIKQYFIQESSKRGQTEKNTTIISGETYGPVIKPGSHVFPFRLQLPQQNMPPSFKGFHGWVRYILVVKLHRSWKPTSSAQAELTFLPRSDGIMDHLLQPQSGTENKKMKLFGSGKMSMTARIDKTGFMQGETIRAFVDIDNSSSRDVKLKYSLKQEDVFIAGKSTNRAHKDIVKATKDCIPSGGKTTFAIDIILPRDMMLTIENCRIIKVQFELKVSLDVSFASDPAVRFPVVIIPAQQQFPSWNEAPPPYLPPLPSFVPYPGGAAPPPPGLYPSLYDPAVLPHPGAAPGVYPDPHPMISPFSPAPSAPVYDPNLNIKGSSNNVPN